MGISDEEKRNSETGEEGMKMRAWNVKEKKWDFVLLNDGLVYNRFTDVKDTFGNEIYEGDIVADYGGEEYAVKLVKGVFLGISKEGKCYNISSPCTYVVGNIYEEISF